MSESTPPAAVGRRASPTTLIAIGLAAITLGVYAQTCGEGFEFLNVDDPDYVTANVHVQQGISPAGLKWALTSLEAYNWHPLTWMSLQLDAELYGLDPRGFHLTNILLHAANTVLLYWLLWRTTGAVWCSALVAALFGLHPAHVESVAWVTERKDTLSTLFWLLTTAAYIRYAGRPTVGRYLLVLVVFALGLMAKPMLVTLPAVLLLMDYWPLRRWPASETPYASASIGRLVLEKLPLFAMVFATIPLTLQAQSDVVRTLEHFSIGIRIENAVVAYAKYVGMLFWPADLCVFYPHPRNRIPLWQTVVSAVVLVAITAIALREWGRRPYLFVGWFWYLGTLVPVIGLVQVGMQALADRYTYVPYIGLSIAVVWGIADLTARWSWRTVPLAVLAAAVLAACVVLSFLQVRHWRTSQTVWTRALAVTTNNTVAHDFLGEDLVRQNKWEAAEKHLRASLKLGSPGPWTRANLAVALEGQGRLDEAADFYEQALAIEPAARIHVRLGRLREQQGRPDDAVGQFAAALAIDPDHGPAYTGLGDVYEVQGKLPEAEEQYAAAVRVQPESADAHADLGRILNRRGRPADALKHYDRAIELKPTSAEAHNNRGVVLEALGRLGDALPSYRRAARLDPEQVVYQCNLAYAHYETGNHEAAAAAYREAFEINPMWPRDALGEAWRRATHSDAAARNGKQALRLAEQVCQATNFRMAQALDVLAAAHAELGQFDKAVSREKEVLTLLPPKRPPGLEKEIRERLQLYESGKPYRQPPLEK
jgi:tetratricopeptide (TPR) repeat protein